MSYYAVKKGRTPGIYDSWNDCKVQVDRFSGAAYKKFDNIEDANEFIQLGNILESNKRIDEINVELNTIYNIEHEIIYDI